MEDTAFAINGCTDRSKNSLKLVAVHLGLSGSLGATGERQVGLARGLCERIMTLQAELSKTRSDKSSASCARIQCINQMVVQPERSSCLSAEDAVVKLIKWMEDDSSLNCGFGSNLTLDGQVECDASLMCSRTRFWAGVGAVQGCRNPIELVKSLRDHRTVARPLGLVQPNLIVGPQTKNWMKDHCPHLIIPNSHSISSGALAGYQKFKSAHDAANRAQLRQTPVDLMDVKMDTVGAIAIDCDDNCACAISSGGIILKYRGRLGQAALPGAGCWAENSAAVVTTGVGELLNTSLFAKMFHEKLSSKKLLHKIGHVNEISLGDVVNDCFAELANYAQPSICAPSERCAGLLAVADLGEEGYHLTCGHNGQSMCVAYMTGNDLGAQSILLDRKEDDIQRQICETIRLNLQ